MGNYRKFYSRLDVQPGSQEYIQKVARQSGEESLESKAGNTGLAGVFCSLLSIVFILVALRRFQHKEL